MNKKYFKNSLKESIKGMLILTVIGLLIYPFVVLFGEFGVRVNGDYIYYPDPMTGTPVTFITILTFIIPVIQTHYLTKKKTIDTFYALPIKRNTLQNTNLVVGYLNIFIPYTIMFFVAFFIMLTKHQSYDMVSYIPLYLTTILASIPLYGFNYFVATRANNTVDAVIFMVMYAFLFMVIFGLHNTYRVLAEGGNECYEILINDGIKRNCYVPSINSVYGFSFAPMITFGNYFFNSIKNEQLFWDIEQSVSMIILIIEWASFILLYFVTKKDKAERAEQISNSAFGYNFLIPYFFIGSLCCLGLDYVDSSIIFAHAAIIVAYLIINVIQYRKLKLPKKVYFKLLIYYIPTLIITLLIDFLSKK